MFKINLIWLNLNKFERFYGRCDYVLIEGLLYNI